MTLKEYINAFPRLQRMEVRCWFAKQLGISEVYIRSMCNGTKPIPAKYALRIEKIKEGSVPRHITVPQFYLDCFDR